MLDREQIEKSRGNKRTHGNFGRVQGLARNYGRLNKRFLKSPGPFVYDDLRCSLCILKLINNS